MAFSTANAPYAIVAGPAGGRITTSTAVEPGPGNVWVMRTTDVVATWSSSSTAYIQTNTIPYGMRKFDPVLVVETTASSSLSVAVGWAFVNSISSSTATYGYAALVAMSTGLL